MARGGRRAGAPGKSYGQRVDLNENRAPITGETSPAPAATPSPTPGLAQPAPTRIVPEPGQLGTFNPTARPDEPLRAGIDGAPTLGAAGDVLAQLRAIYLQHPTEALRELIAFNSTGNA